MPGAVSAAGDRGGGTGLQRRFLTFVKALASHIIMHDIRNTLPPSDAAELDVTVIFSQRPAAHCAAPDS